MRDTQKATQGTRRDAEDSVGPSFSGAGDYAVAGVYSSLRESEPNAMLASSLRMRTPSRDAGSLTHGRLALAQRKGERLAEQPEPRTAPAGNPPGRLQELAWRGLRVAVPHQGHDFTGVDDGPAGLAL
jgi:hypothetical protein